MKSLLILLASSLIIAFILFAVFYWLMNWKFNESVIVSVSGALGGLATEYLKIFLKKKSGNKQTSYKSIGSTAD